MIYVFTPGKNLSVNNSKRKYAINSTLSRTPNLYGDVPLRMSRDVWVFHVMFLFSTITEKSFHTEVMERASSLWLFLSTGVNNDSFHFLPRGTKTKLGSHRFPALQQPPVGRDLEQILYNLPNPCLYKALWTKHP